MTSSRQINKYLLARRLMSLPVIEKQLKDYTWKFNFETKELFIAHEKSGHYLTIPKTQWFSLFRFLIRISQALSRRRRK